MIKVNNASSIFLILLILISCAKDDDVGNRIFSPSESIQGTWISAGKSDAKLIITDDNLIESYAENEFSSNYESLDFKKEFGSEEYLINEVIDEYSYKLTIERKDGGTLKNNISLKVLKRKYTLYYYNGRLALALDQMGQSNGYLRKQ